jgi:hypothetical protein
MTLDFSPPLLLAQIEKWREMGREFQSDHPKPAPGLIAASLIVLAIVVVFLWLLARLMNRQEGRRLFNNPKQLFKSLCRAHDLSGADRRLLLQIARIGQISQPASLFLEPEPFDAAETNPALDEQQSAIGNLRGRLFGTAAAPVAAAPAAAASGATAAIAAAAITGAARQPLAQST